MGKRKLIIAVTVFWILLIWGHSMMPGHISENESGFITDILKQFFGDVDNLNHYVRKAAHFTEYAVLGVLTLLDLYICFGRLKFNIAVTMFLFIPFIDETIQLFVVNRNSAISDMWIDIAGAMFGFAVSALIYRKIIKK